LAITIKTQFESSVTNANEDIYTRSYIENNKTIIEFDVKKRRFINKDKTKRNVVWDEHSTYNVDINELSTLYNQIIYRFKITKGYYYDSNGNRVFFTPEIDEVSTAKHVSLSAIRLSSYLAVVCGVTLRNISIIYTFLFNIPTSKSTIKRWIDEIGSNLPDEDEILKKLININPPSECHIDGYYPMGTDNCVMVVKDEDDRILITKEVKSENKEDAIKFLRKLKSLGLKITSAFSDYSKSYTSALKEVFPDVVLQADHFHTIKNIWKHLKNAFYSFRRTIKDQNNCSDKFDVSIDALALKLWDIRWIILKKPENLTLEEKNQIKELEAIDTNGFVKNFRRILKKIVNLFDKSSSESSAKQRFDKLKTDIKLNNNKHYTKIIKFIESHWNEATQYLTNHDNKKRSSNSESGMRMLRRLEKNHDGIRSEITRKNYIKIYQYIKYFSNEDIALYINKAAPDV